MSDPQPQVSADGFVVVDKPMEWTSHDVVGRLRRLLHLRRVGHGGTLDPMATGVLVVAAGPSTRLLTYVSGSDKEYLATIRLGQSTITDDAQGEVSATVDASPLTDSEIMAAVSPLTGEIWQVPSSVSAIKVGGVRSYTRVRAGEKVELAARQVRVETFVVSQIVRSGPMIDLQVRVVCSSGTYIRALARDLGAALGVGGHLTMLRRTRVGAFTLEQAWTVTDAQEAPALMSPAAAAKMLMPVAQVGALDIEHLRHGRAIMQPDGRAESTESAVAAAIDEDGRLVAVVRAQEGQLRPVLVMAGPQ